MRAIVSVAAACALLPALAAGAEAGTARKVRVAVLEMRNLGTEAVKAELLSEVALTEASRIAGLEVIGKSDIAAIVGFEKQKQMLGCSEELSCLGEVAGALGVDYLLLGSLGRLGQLYRVDLKVVDAKKARVVSRAGESVKGEEERLVAAVQEAVHQLLGPVAKPAPPRATAIEAAPTATTAPAAVEAGPRSRFDGRWKVTLHCADAESAKGYSREFEGSIAGGVFVADLGAPGAPASLHVEGPVRPDGSAVLVAKGITGGRAYSLRGARPGTPFTYRIQARFDEKQGRGARVEQRPCDFTFTRT